MQTTSFDELAPADLLAELFRRRGIELDIDHLKDRAMDRDLAGRERQKARHADAVGRVRAMAGSVWRARRAVEAAQTSWRIDPTPRTLADVHAARSARNEAEQAMREELLGDDAQMAAVLRDTRP